ncbi:hypothetical protein [Bradyrhizobium sp. SZCCHNR1070]|uniref:hypothetical protein n=1 Tax=Bradyrhizobium sp. SZCCHNR1070 TaxID=3057361 RepID=UPI002916110D|nr:hypothetical protein [Bradyrhizobium sp. SZCCHNR1070]
MDPSARDFSEDTPLRLDVAVKAAFPAGGITVAGLRKEIAKGRLEVELIAGKLFTTLAAIARMRELCKVPRRIPEEIQSRRRLARAVPVGEEVSMEEFIAATLNNKFGRGGRNAEGKKSKL